MALYDRIGRTYDSSRSADPDIVERLAGLLLLAPGAPYLDVACGTGNYTAAMANRGAIMYGIELSATMLDKARSTSAQVKWCRADAESLPFRGARFAGAMCTLAIHHMANPARVFQEVFRVLDSGRFVIFTADREQIRRYWLMEYFPRGVRRAVEQMVPVDKVIDDLRNAGFRQIRTEPWGVTESLRDLFFYAGKQRPEIYFDPVVRAGISYFAHGLVDADETVAGLAKLEADIKSGRFDQVAESYRNDLGDYMFVCGAKA